MSKLSRFAANAALGSVVIVSLCACNKADRTQGSAPPAASSAAAQPAVSNEQEQDSQLTEKLNKYIDCLNNISEQILRARQDYFSFADEKKGPSAKGDPRINLYISAAQTCLEGLAKVKPLPPPLPALEATVTAYEQSVREIVPLIKQVNEYYKQGNYKDDKFAKGKAMHGPLVAAFAKFAAVNKELDDKVTKINEDLSARRLIALQKDPTQKLHYLVARSEKEAKVLVDVAVVKDLKDLDLAKLTALLGIYEKTVGEIDTYTSAHKDEVDKVNSFPNFENQTKSFLKSVKELMRRKRDGKDFKKESGYPTSIDGHPAQVLEQYNRLITDGNGLYFH